MILYAAMAAFFFSITIGMVISMLIASAKRSRGRPQDDRRVMLTGCGLAVFIWIGLMVLAIALVLILDP